MQQRAINNWTPAEARFACLVAEDAIATRDVIPEVVRIFVCKALGEIARGDPGRNAFSLRARGRPKSPDIVRFYNETIRRSRGVRYEASEAELFLLTAGGKEFVYDASDCLLWIREQGHRPARMVCRWIGVFLETYKAMPRPFELYLRAALKAVGTGADPDDAFSTKPPRHRQDDPFLDTRRAQIFNSLHEDGRPAVHAEKAVALIEYTLSTLNGERVARKTPKAIRAALRRVGAKPGKPGRPRKKT